LGRLHSPTLSPTLTLTLTSRRFCRTRSLSVCSVTGQRLRRAPDSSDPSSPAGGTPRILNFQGSARWNQDNARNQMIHGFCSAEVGEHHPGWKPGSASPALQQPQKPQPPMRPRLAVCGPHLQCLFCLDAEFSRIFRRGSRTPPLHKKNRNYSL